MERTTNHDVKAIEYVLKEKFRQHEELNKVLNTSDCALACPCLRIRHHMHSPMLGVVPLFPLGLQSQHAMKQSAWCKLQHAWTRFLCLHPY